MAPHRESPCPLTRPGAPSQSPRRRQSHRQRTRRYAHSNKQNTPKTSCPQCHHDELIFQHSKPPMHQPISYINNPSTKLLTPYACANHAEILSRQYRGSCFTKASTSALHNSASYRIEDESAEPQLPIIEINSLARSLSFKIFSQKNSSREFDTPYRIWHCKASSCDLSSS